MEILLIMAVFIGLMYFMMVVPQKKRAEQQRKMLDSLEPGSRVLLNSGIFGTIRARGEQQLVIELAPGVEVTVLKQTVVRTANPDEEEFEYAEDQIAAAPVDSFVADSLEQAPARPASFPLRRRGGHRVFAGHRGGLPGGRAHGGTALRAGPLSKAGSRASAFVLQQQRPGLYPGHRRGGLFSTAAVWAPGSISSTFSPPCSRAFCCGPVTRRPEGKAPAPGPPRRPGFPRR